MSGPSTAASDKQVSRSVYNAANVRDAIRGPLEPVLFPPRDSTFSASQREDALGLARIASSFVVGIVLGAVGVEGGPALLAGIAGSVLFSFAYARASAASSSGGSKKKNDELAAELDEDGASGPQLNLSQVAGVNFFPSLMALLLAWSAVHTSLRGGEEGRGFALLTHWGANAEVSADGAGGAAAGPDGAQ